MVWSLPVIAASAAAPALAASPVPTLSVAGRGSWNLDFYTGVYDNRRSIKFYSIIPGTATPGQGFCVDNTRTTTRLTDASVTYYVTADVSLYFNPRLSTGTSGWSNLSADTSKSPKYYNGDYYYPFTTRYTGSISAKNGSTCFPAYAFESQTGVATRGLFYVEHTVTADGNVLTANYDRVPMS